MRSGFCYFLFLLLCAVILLPPPAARAVDALADSAVISLAQLTDPRRLELLSDDVFRAQLGPALGWLHVARRRDVAPEAVIARAFALNGLAGERARLTRESLLRNLARADSWELFAHDDTALALSVGRPAQIPVGIHRGHAAQTAVVVPDGLTTGRTAGNSPASCCAPTTRCPTWPPPRHRQPGDMLAKNSAGPPCQPRVRMPPAPATGVFGRSGASTQCRFPTTNRCLPYKRAPRSSCGKLSTRRSAVFSAA